jgi:hypothetical protein
MYGMEDFELVPFTIVGESDRQHDNRSTNQPLTIQQVYTTISSLSIRMELPTERTNALQREMPKEHI